LVGGSSRIPYVKEAIEKRFKISPFLVDKPELAVCLGAAIYEVSRSSAPIPLKPIAYPPPEEAKAPSEEAKDYYTRGAEKYQAGDYVGAIADLDQAIRLDPNNAVFYSNRGNAYSNQEDYQRAIADFDQAIRLNPYVAVFYSNRGNAYSKQGEYQQAIDDYNQALKKDPNFPESNSVRTQINKIRLQLDGQKQKDVTNYKREDSAGLKHQEKEIQQAFEEREAEIKSNGRLSDGADSYFKKLIPYLQSQGFQCSQNVICGNYTLDCLALTKIGKVPFQLIATADFKVVLALTYLDKFTDISQWKAFSDYCIHYATVNDLNSVPLFGTHLSLLCPIIVVDEVDMYLAEQVNNDKPFSLGGVNKRLVHCGVNKITIK